MLVLPQLFPDWLIDWLIHSFKLQAKKNKGSAVCWFILSWFMTHSWLMTLLFCWHLITVPTLSTFEQLADFPSARLNNTTYQTIITGYRYWYSNHQQKEEVVVLFDKEARTRSSENGITSYCLLSLLSLVTTHNTTSSSCTGTLYLYFFSSVS